MQPMYTFTVAGVEYEVADKEARAELGREVSRSILSEVPPSESTKGVVGQLYLDTVSGIMYKCVAVSGQTYTWEPIFSGGDIKKPLYMCGENIYFKDSNNNVVFFIGSDFGKMSVGGRTPGSRVVISGVDEPQSNSDAANRFYVDNQIERLEYRIKDLERKVRQYHNE